MKIKLTNHQELRQRQSIDVSSPKITDQSSKKMTDINNIMLQYSKTGLLPVQQEKLARYIDNTKIMPLEEAHAQITRAREMFYDLPAQIRKLMDNDPTKLVSFIRDEDNKEILLKHGILKKAVVSQDETKSQDETHSHPSGDKILKEKKSEKDSK